MPAMVRATPSYWMPRPWKRNASGTIRAAAFFIRSSPDAKFRRSVGNTVRGGRDRRADLCRPGFLAGGCAEDESLASASWGHRQLPVAAGLGRGPGRSPAAAGGDAACGRVAVTTIGDM